MLRQICNLIPPWLVSQVARRAGAESRVRTFTPWSHVVTMLYAQLAHAVHWQIWTALLVYVLLRYLAFLSRWQQRFTRLWAICRSTM